MTADRERPAAQRTVDAAGRGAPVSAGTRPWWASDPDAAASDDADPIESHRAARRGGRTGWGRATHDTGGIDHEHPAGGFCAVCPICSLARSLGRADPEVLAHLSEAAAHLAAAARAFAASGGETRDPDGGDPR